MNVSNSDPDRSFVETLASPFVALWNWLLSLSKALGRILALGLGFILIVAGLVISMTVIGAFIGIPLAIFGLTLVIAAFA